MSGVLTSGEHFARRYYIESMIAEGGMAEIYRARDEKLSRLVAVKVLYPYFADNQVIRQRFAEEGRIQQILEHPNIVYVHEVIEEPLAIVMEHVDGPTLDDYLADRGQLEEGEILDIIIPIMSALGLAHSKGIIHRDLKPSNILLNRQRGGFQPKVMDFGVAKVKDAKHDLTATGTTVGTLHYMSPEQIVGSKTIDGRADIYSLGVTLFKLVTGEVPFNAPTEFALMMAQVEAAPLEPSKLREDLSPEFERIILKSMEKKPVDRFQSIREFTTALLGMKQGASERTVRDTITETISQELIDFAMAADSVAVDRTGEMSLRVINDEQLAAFDSNEPTLELEATHQMRRDNIVPREGATEELEPTNDSTVELSTSEILKLSALDATEESFPDAGDSNASTAVMDRPAGSRSIKRLPPEEVHNRVTRPSGVVNELGTGKLVSESIDTESINQRIKLEADRVVVLDDDAGSRDVTAPKVSEDAYQRILGGSGRQEPPSGPRVVLGYNPADTQEKTVEKPNYRTQLPEFETARNQDRQSPARAVPEPPRPQLPGTGDEEPSFPSLPPIPSPKPKNAVSSIIQQIDVLANSALQTADEHNLPRGLVIAGVFLAFVCIGCIVLLAGYWVLG